MNQFSRTQLIFGKEAMEKIRTSHIAIFGIGGVGGYTAEALVRSGVGTLSVVDDDRICLTNINRQIFATRKTVGQFKTDAAEERLKDINPDVKIIKHKCFYKLGLSKTISGSTIYINAATTLSFFGKEEQALEIYNKAALCFVSSNKTNTYEYAALLNNKAGTLNALKRYDEAEQNWKEAIEILKSEGKHDGEIAISLVMLAHLTFDRDDNAYEQVEALLDEAWEYINSQRQVRDGNYAYVLRKCAPSFDYFQRPIEAQALRDVAQEIYKKYRG